MRKHFIILLLFFQVIFCFSQASIQDGNKLVGTGSFGVIIPKNFIETPLPKFTKNEIQIIYDYKDDTLFQSISIRYITSQEISFSLKSINKLRHTAFVLNGIAKSKPKMDDQEIDEDEEGNAYECKQYNYYDNGCYLSIRVEDNSKQRVQLHQYKCDDLMQKIIAPSPLIRIYRKVKTSK